MIGLLEDMAGLSKLKTKHILAYDEKFGTVSKKNKIKNSESVIETI